MSNGISIIVPYIRPAGAERCAEFVRRNAGSLPYEILAVEDKERIGCPKMVKMLAEQAKGNLVCFLGDDTMPGEGFLAEALAAMATLPDGWGLVGLNDGYTDGRKNATHWLADKRLLPLIGGEFFHTGYHHGCCDNELTEKALSLGRYVWAEKARLVHDNPICRREPLTQEYAETYKYAEQDARLFCKRMRWGSIAYGVRVGHLDPAFFCSWTQLLMKRPGCDSVLHPAIFMPHVAACNFLVDRFLNHTDCDTLLFIDDDMDFDADAVSDLRQQGWNYGILSGLSCCRKYPHMPIVFQRNEQGQRVVNLDFGGGIAEVDYTGLAFTMIRREVLNAVIDASGTKTAFNWSNNIGEDGEFCVRARAVGCKIGVAARPVIGHRVGMTARWDMSKRAVVMGVQNFLGGLDEDNKKTQEE